MTKENFKEESHLFKFQRKIYEKVNLKLNIAKLGAKIETFAIEKKLVDCEKEKKEVEEIYGTATTFSENFIQNNLNEKIDTPLFKEGEKY